MEQDVEWLQYQVERLTEQIEALEKENFELSRCIGQAISSLKKDNKEAREYIANEEKKIIAFDAPQWKQPKWRRQD